MKSIKFVLAALAAVGGGARAQAADGVLSQSKVFAFDQLVMRKLPNGGESRDVVQGQLATGEAVSIHESMQPAGALPNPAHRIEHSEFILVQEGTLEFLHDGKVERAGPGSVIYVAYGTLHGVKNVGDGRARYTVIAIAGDVKK